MKRKLSDLKENECINIRSEKQLNKLKKQIKQFHNYGLNKNGYKTAQEGLETYKQDTCIRLVNEHGGKIINYASKDFYDREFQLDILPASDFIKPKKSKLKKVWQEIARMDGRIADLEDRNKNPNTGLPVPSECETKELTELPKKWCVVDNKIVSKWASKKFNCCNDVFEYKTYLHVGDGEDFKEYLFEEYIIDGFTLISQSDFERLVLNKPKEIIQEKEIDWSVIGQLVSDRFGIIVMINEDQDRDQFKGTIVSGDEKVGYQTEWSKECFKLFNGSICLKNE